MASRARPMKRPAAALVTPVAKKPAVSDPEAVAKKPAGSSGKEASTSCSLVAKAVANAPGYPPEVLGMLSNILPQTLGVAKEERHDFQARVIEMVGEALRSSEASIQAQLKVAEEGLSKVEADKAGCEKEEASSKATAEEKAQAQEVAETALKESVAALNVAQEALTKAQEEQKTCEADLAAAHEKLAMLESTKTDIWDTLREGTAEKVPANVKMLIKVAKDFSFDASLLKALPNAIGKVIGARSAFDGIVLEQAEAEFRRCTEALQQTITTGDSAKSEQAAKVSSAASELEQAAESEKGCQEALKIAQAEQKEADASHKAVSKALQALDPEMMRVRGELERVSTSLQDFRMGPWKAYRELAESTAASALVEGEAALEEAPAEPAA